MEQALREVARGLDDKVLDSWGAAFNYAANFEFVQRTAKGSSVSDPSLDGTLKAARRAGIKAMLIAMACEGLEFKWTSKT